MFRFVFRVFINFVRLAVLVACVVLGLVVWYAMTPVRQTAETLDVEITHGRTMREVSQQVVGQGVVMEPWFFTWMARLTQRAAQIQAGTYRIEKGMSPWELLTLFSQGSTQYTALRIVEGWSLRRLRSALDANPDLRHDTLGRSDQELQSSLALEEKALEGLFFPDTYHVSRGVSDVEVLRRAQQQMQKVLQKEWAQRAKDLPFKTAYEGLILASVVEKETGLAADRGKIASVFVNRLKIKMPLQSDPTVIYGLGSNFDGNLTRKDLQRDTVFNTYTRNGLPPTPIAMPSLAALRAVLNPPQTEYLYFVARGDGSSHFSRSLDEHNRAVTRYQRGG